MIPQYIAYKSIKNIDDDKIKFFTEEIKKTFKAKNSYFVTPFYVISINKKTYVCMKAMEGTLIDLLKVEYDKTSCYLYVLQIIKGLLNLHKMDIKHHQDLNPPNILFEDLSKKFTGFPPDNLHTSFRYKICISDLGIADLYDPETSTNKFGGKFAFKSPEQYEGSGLKGFNPDVFSLGIIIHLIFTKTHPAGLNIGDLSKSKKPNFPKKTGWETWAKTIDKKINMQDLLLKELVEKMLSVEPHSRPKLEDVFDKIKCMLREQNNKAYNTLKFYFDYYDKQDRSNDNKNVRHKTLYGIIINEAI